MMKLTTLLSGVCLATSAVIAATHDHRPSTPAEAVIVAAAPPAAPAAPTAAAEARPTSEDAPASVVAPDRDEWLHAMIADGDTSDADAARAQEYYYSRLVRARRANEIRASLEPLSRAYRRPTSDAVTRSSSSASKIRNAERRRPDSIYERSHAFERDGSAYDAGRKHRRVGRRR